MQPDEAQVLGGKDAPLLTFPQKEADLIRARYESAKVILEYGSGGSTYLAASLPGKLVMTVESSSTWAVDLQRRLDKADLPSPAIVQHVNIGTTGDWGRPLDESSWRNYHRYPTSIWAAPFFRDPDLILIDGRFRAACFVAAYLRVQKPATVLFDDYTNRPAYHMVEILEKPIAFHGRMAEFSISPGQRAPWMYDLFNDLLGDVTIATEAPFHYKARNCDGYPFNQK